MQNVVSNGLYSLICTKFYPDDDWEERVFYTPVFTKLFIKYLMDVAAIQKRL